MLTLSSEIQKAIIDAGGEPVRLSDPDNNREYVLLRAEVFDRLRDVISYEPLNREEQKALLVHAGLRAGWNDPDMDAYDQLDPRRQP